MKFSHFGQIEDYLNQLVNYERSNPMPLARGKPDFGRLLRAIRRADLWKTPPITVHIAGTKGKGSTLLYLEAMLNPTWKVISFLSPHLLSIRERILISGEPTNETLWIQGFNRLHRVLENSQRKGEPLTYFETLFLLYLWMLFHEKGDIALVEVGLGGTYDCTNILTPTMSVETPIDLDHTEILGKSLLEIARNKAGIIKSGRPVVISRQKAKVRRELCRRAAACHSKTMVLGRDFNWRLRADGLWDYWHEGRKLYTGLSLRAWGNHQRDNAATALCAITMRKEKGLRLSEKQVRSRLRRVVLPARLELLPGAPPTLLDVAHNPASFRVLADFLKANYLGKRILLISGMLEQKDFCSSLKYILPYVSEAIFVRLSHPRSRPPSDLAAFASSRGVKARMAQSERDAFECLLSRSDFDLVVVAGSFVLAGAFLTWKKTSHRRTSAVHPKAP
jgi:dihydrofolate synthase/folylpolyglutamate synthase